MKDFEWNEEKNQWIKENRNISFEEIVFFIENGGCLILMNTQTKRNIQDNLYLLLKRIHMFI